MNLPTPREEFEWNEAKKKADADIVESGRQMGFALKRCFLMGDASLMDALASGKVKPEQTQIVFDNFCRAEMPQYFIKKQGA